MNLILKVLIRNCKLPTLLAACLTAILCFLVIRTNHVKVNVIKPDKLQTIVSKRVKFYSFATNYDRKDWHDWKFIEYEKTREGPGEQGKEYKLTDPDEIERNEKIYKENGLYGLVSDKISVNRSIPDMRPEKCQSIQYFKSLPLTSVIIIYHNEYFSVLLRTVHSIVNRTPRELLLEILLVNDASTYEDLYEPLQNYVDEHFNVRVKIINLPERSGLIVARMEGVRRAKGEILMFLDAHMDVNVNWLPPLLEPIMIDPKTSTTPNVDNFDCQTFEYLFCYDQLQTRGCFNKNFDFAFLSRLPEDKIYPERPAPNPIMLGGAFAIRKDYFLDIGGYDEGLKIWNGEHYELSLKLWLCGGKILEVPCSRVGHVFRDDNKHREIAGGFDYEAYNFKRVSEVWLDDFKEIIYRNDPERYINLDAGDLTRAKRIKKSLDCKPFSYFLDQVAPDMAERYTFYDPGVFARGAIQSEADEAMCADAFQNDESKFRLFECDQNLTHPKTSQNFELSWNRHIKMSNKRYSCITDGELDFSDCHFKFGNQLWYYDLITHQIVNLPKKNCFTAEHETKSVISAPCVEENMNQKWRWGYTNITALNNWESFGIKLPHHREKYVVEV